MRWIGKIFASALFGAACLPAIADPLPQGAVGQNIEAIGYSELGGYPGFKMSIVQSGDRWYLYVGHFWHRGWSIVDVTDPKDPKVGTFIPGPSNTSTGQADIGGASMTPGLERKPRGRGGDAGKPHDEAVLIWDIKAPVNPKHLGQSKT